MEARFPTTHDPIVSHIEALPVNAAHRASARAHYLAAERSVGRMCALQAGICAIVAACRGVFGMRERSQY
jgi:hypothetical protein